MLCRSRHSPQFLLAAIGKIEAEGVDFYDFVGFSVAAGIFPGGDPAFDYDLAAFGEIAPGKLGPFFPAYDRDIVGRCVLVFARHLHGEVEVCHGRAALRVSDFRFLSQTAQKPYMVKHLRFLLVLAVSLQRPAGCRFHHIGRVSGCADPYGRIAVLFLRQSVSE